MSHKHKKKHGPSGPPRENRGAPIPVGPVASAPVIAPAAPIEDVEPRADSAPMPAWLFILMVLLVYWGMLHLDRYGGGFNELVYGPYQSYAQMADLQPKSGAEQLMITGKSVYEQVCMACHQPTGLGNPGQAPPLAGSEWVQGPPHRLIRIPLNGLTGPVRVGDQTWNLQMPPFRGGPLLDDDKNVAAVLTYIRQSFGNQAAPISPDQVKAIRAETEARPAQWTADELLKLPDTP